MQSEQAADIFLQRVASRAYKSAIETVQRFLTDGPIERKPKPSDAKLHDWYKNLDGDQQNNVNQVIQKTAFSVVFGLLVLLDNQTMGYPIDGQLSDFALYIQTYENTSTRSEDKCRESIRVNRSGNSLSLHDLIINYIDLDS